MFARGYFMFEALFKSEQGLARHRAAPLAEERARYIQHCVEHGATHSTVELKCREVSVRSSHLDRVRVSNKCPLVSKRTPQEWV
jgi:hypothetical protein